MAEDRARLQSNHPCQPGAPPLRKPVMHVPTLALALFPIFCAPFTTSASLSVAAGLAGSFGLVALVLTYRIAQQERAWLWFLFALVFVAFHLGLSALVFLPEQFDAISPIFGLDWARDRELMSEAFLASCLFLSGYLAVRAVWIAETTVQIQMTKTRTGLYGLSLVLLLFVEVFFFGTIKILGIPDYGVFHSELAETIYFSLVFPIAFAAIPTALIAAVQTGPARWALLIFVPWAAWAFVWGLRGEAILPGVLALGILADRGRFRVHWPVLLVAVTAFIGASAFVADTRIERQSSMLEGVNPVVLGGSELGGSLRPLVEVIQWRQLDGLRMGETYYAPFERTFVRLVPVTSRKAAQDDDRLTSVLIAQRAGAYGFSIVAEAYYNFGLLGAWVMGAIASIGILAADRSLGRGAFSPLALAAAVALFAHVRQSFVVAFGNFFMVLTISLLLTVLARLLAPARLRARAY